MTLILFQGRRIFESPQRETNPHMTSLLRNDSVYSFQSASAISGDNHGAPTPPSTPYKVSYAGEVRVNDFLSRNLCP